jgi:RNA polymerase sigma-70 factor (ECF subfamily)
MSAATPVRHAVPAAEEADDVLAARAAAGDRAAFERLMRRHNRRLFRLARATLRDEAEAEDALQEAYLAAYRGLGRFRGEAALGTWLARLVLNECLSRRRRRSRRDNIVQIRADADAPQDGEHAAEAGDAALPGGPDEDFARAELRALIERRLDELPEAFRLVFVLRCVEDLSVEETSRCLDIPEATVRSRHFRARSLLREALARDIDLAEGDVFAFGGARCDRVVARVLARLAG